MTKEYKKRQGWDRSLLVIIPTLAIGTILAGYAFSSKKRLDALTDKATELRESIRVNKELAESKDELISRFIQRNKHIRDLDGQVRRIFYKTEDLNSFPVSHGERVAFTVKSKGNGLKYLYYVPEGEHEIAFQISQTQVLGHAGSSYIQNVIHSPKFQLPPGSRGAIDVSLDNKDDKCLLKIEQLDADSVQIDSKEFTLEKRTLLGSEIPSGSGVAFYSPGEFSRPNGFYSWPTADHRFQMKKEENVVKILGISSSIRSPTKQKFIRIENVASFISDPKYKKLLDKEFVDGRIYISDSERKALLH